MARLHESKGVRNARLKLSGIMQRLAYSVRCGVAVAVAVAVAVQCKSCLAWLECLPAKSFLHLHLLSLVVVVVVQYDGR